VRPFVASYLEAIGATVRRSPAGVLAVQWPPTHVGRFGPATTLAFDPVVAEAAKADLCVVGSDILDRILADASGRGFHCVARVDAEGEHPPADVLAANLAFPNARATVLAAESGAVPYTLFNFRVTLETDEKVDLLRSVLLNAETLQEHTASDLFLQESLTLPEEAIVGPSDLAAAYRAACAALERSVEADVAAVKGKASGLLADDLQRIEAFYDTSIQELYESRRQAPLEAERVFRAEGERRTEEVRRRYAFTAKARLVNVRTILVPTTTIRVRVENARVSAEVALEFDAVNLETARPPCHACGSPTATIHLCSRGHFACETCRRGCTFCDEVACATCAPDALAACATCVKPACPDHAFLDEIGRKPYCGDHIHACAICGRMVGPPYVRACGLCNQSYCAVDVEAYGRCTTCRTLAAVPATHGDVVRATAERGAPKNVTKWVRGKNGKFTVLVGKGAIFQYLYVLDKEGATVHRRKGTGLLRG